MSLKKARKADLSLSTNAIVVLIIAIVVLGLALGFTRGVFSKLAEQIAGLGRQTLVEEPPTYDKPVTISSTQVEIRKGKSSSLTIAVFNRYTVSDKCNEGTEPDCYMEFNVSLGPCLGKGGNYGGGEGSGGISLIAPYPKRILINQYESFQSSLKVSPGLAVGDYACTIYASQVIHDPNDYSIIAANNVLASKDLMVTVI